MAITLDGIELCLARMAEEIVLLCNKFEDELKLQISEIKLQRDKNDFLACGVEVKLSGSAYTMKRGELD